MRKFKLDNAAGWTMHLLELKSVTDRSFVFQDVNTGTDFVYPCYISETISEWSVDDKFRYFPSGTIPTRFVRFAHNGERDVALIFRGLKKVGVIDVERYRKGDLSQFEELIGSRLTALKHFNKVKYFISEESFQYILDNSRMTPEDLKHHHYSDTPHKINNLIAMRMKCCKKQELIRRSSTTT